MVLIKVQYDAYNRQFKLLDRELARVLEDGETCMLIADVSIKDLESTQYMKVPSKLVPVPEEAIAVPLQPNAPVSLILSREEISGTIVDYKSDPHGFDMIIESRSTSA